eukprot:829511_1
MSENHEKQQQYEYYNSNNINVANIIKSEATTSIINNNIKNIETSDLQIRNTNEDDEKSETTTNKSYVIGTDKSSQSQSPPPNNIINNHNNNQKIIYSNRLNKKSASPPPGNSLFAYTFDTKSTSRSPKRRSSFSSMSSHSASDILNLTNIHSTHSDTPPRQQTQINYHTYQITNNELPIKRSDKFGIQRNRNRNALSTKSVASGTSKFIYNNNNTPLLDASNDINDIYKSRSKSNPNILDDSPSPRTKKPDTRIKYEPKKFIGRRRAASFETKQNKLIAQKQAFIKINRKNKQTIHELSPHKETNYKIQNKNRKKISINK